MAREEVANDEKGLKKTSIAKLERRVTTQVQKSQTMQPQQPENIRGAGMLA